MPRKSLSGPVLALIVIGSLVVLCCGAGAVTVLAQPRPDRVAPVTAAAAPVVPDPFDRTAFDAYWAANVSDDVQATVTTVDWSGVVLTAHTQLVAGAGAVQPATDACTALAGFWNLTGREFQGVRVVDAADQILVSRHTITDNCTWRR